MTSATPPDVLPVTTTRRQTRRTYDAVSRFYDLTEGLLETPARKAALRSAAVRPGEAVLEIGPGTGWVLRRLSDAAGPAGLVCGVDLSPGMLAVARRKLHGRRALLALGDALALPCPDRRFDLALMSFVLDLIPTDQLDGVLAETLRVLKPGGRLVQVSITRERANLATRAYEWAHNRFPAVVDCRPIYVRRLMEAAGFEIVEARVRSLFGLPVELVVGRRPA